MRVKRSSRLHLNASFVLFYPTESIAMVRYKWASIFFIKSISHKFCKCVDEMYGAAFGRTLVTPHAVSVKSLEASGVKIDSYLKILEEAMKVPTLLFCNIDNE